MGPESSAIDEYYFQWHITEQRNRRCRHCYQNEHPFRDIPLVGLKLVLSRMEETLVKWGRKGSLYFNGGEPFLREAELFALIEQVDQIPSVVSQRWLYNGQPFQ